ncbi:MAG: PAS domain-containing protein [Gemmatimonadetes bacterium]|nr:PAS domain-containing protein [Gemmatimonadota bacterium]
MEAAGALILEANHAAGDFYGTSPAALAGARLDSLWAEPASLDDVLELGATIGVHLADVVHRHPSGEARHVELYLSPMSRGRIHVIVHDTSERARAEARARELHAERVARAVMQQAADEWRATFDAISQPIMVMDGAGRVVRGNRAAAAFADGSPGATGPGDAAFREALTAVVRDLRVDQQLQDADGRTWAASAWPTGVDQRVILVLQELTTLLALQHEVQRRETLARMGELVAGVAHEVRNPLFAITSLLDAARQRLGNQPDFARLAPMFDAQVERLSALMRDLLEYGRPAELERRATTVQALVDAAQLALAPIAAAAGITLRAEVGDAGTHLLEVDRVRFGQLLVNLGGNAIQHAPPGGVVMIGAVRHSGSLVLSVSDDGPGFPPDLLPHVFEPFVTRRPGGTGLGLAIAHRVAHQHGAKIEAANRVDANGAVQGAIVTVHVPTPPPPAHA